MPVKSGRQMQFTLRLDPDLVARAEALAKSLRRPGLEPSITDVLRMAVTVGVSCVEAGELSDADIEEAARRAGDAGVDMQEVEDAARQQVRELLQGSDVEERAREAAVEAAKDPDLVDSARQDASDATDEDQIRETVIDRVEAALDGEDLDDAAREREFQRRYSEEFDRLRGDAWQRAFDEALARRAKEKAEAVSSDTSSSLYDQRFEQEFAVAKRRIRDEFASRATERVRTRLIALRAAVSAVRR